jgi:hypothetical protein
MEREETGYEDKNEAVSIRRAHQKSPISMEIQRA